MNIRHFLKPYRSIFIGVGFIGLISTFLAAAQPLLGKFLIDEVIIAKKYSFSLVLSVIIFVIVIGFGLAMATKYLYFNMSLKLMVDMKSAFYKHLLALPFSFFSRNRTGDILSRMNEDLTEIQRLYTENILQLFTISVTFLINLALLLFLDWHLAILSFVFIPILVFGIHKFRTLIIFNQMELRKKSAANQSFLYETFCSISFIRSAHLEKKMEQKFINELEGMNRQTIKSTFINTCAQSVPQLVIMTSTIIMVWMLGARVMNGSMTLGTMLAFMAYQAGLFGTIQGLTQLYIRLQKGKPSIQRVNEFFQLKQIENGNQSFPADFKELRFENVSFSHGSQSPVFQDLNLTIKSQEKIGMVGINGIGKSTIAYMLSRMYAPHQGKIFIDNQSINEFTHESWTESVCLIAHDHPVLHGSIFEFLQLGKKTASIEEMLAVLDIVGLTEWLQIKPEGLHTIVGERAVTLSAGEKQRLLIARALLHDAEIYILDEATCHLDADSERKLFLLLVEKLEGKTVIVISHRHENLMCLDRTIDISKLTQESVLNEVVGG